MYNRQAAKDYISFQSVKKRKICYIELRLQYGRDHLINKSDCFAILTTIIEASMREWLRKQYQEESKKPIQTIS
jgi:hypothetical protein